MGEANREAAAAFQDDAFEAMKELVRFDSGRMVPEEMVSPDK